MDSILPYLKLPALHLAAAMTWMFWVILGDSTHRVVSEKFAGAMRRLLPPLVLLALIAAVFHPAGVMMSAAILTPYPQWLAVRGLYRSFEQIHGRAPDLRSDSFDDVIFRMMRNMVAVAMPVILVLGVGWLTRNGGRVWDIPG